MSIEGCGPCDLCGAVAKLVVDHEHSTGLIRGELCRACNRALVELWENKEWRDKAVQYLSRNTGKLYRESKYPDEAMNVVVTLRITADQRESWEAAAKENGLPLSKWIRYNLNQAQTREP